MLVGVSLLAWGDMPAPGKRLISGAALIMTGVIIVAAEAHKYPVPNAPMTRETRIGIALVLSGSALFLGTIIFTEIENLRNGR